MSKGTVIDDRIAPPGIIRATIDLNAAGAPSDDDLTLINRLAKRQLSAEEVYAFPCVPSTDMLDAYFTRMSMSSLTNYARDCQIGVAVMNSHRTSAWFGGVELPIGRSYHGELKNGGESTQLFAKAYMLRNYQPNENTANTDTLIRGIEAGMIFDLSIGFKPGWYRCGICNRDLFDRDCPHYPGQRYDGVRAFAWVEDAHMGEFSFVYDGATPGAGIMKAERAMDAGTLDRKAISDLEDCYGIRLARRWAVPDLDTRDGANASPEKGGVAVKGSQFIELILASRVGRELSAANISTLRGLQEAIQESSDTLEDAAERLAELLSRVDGTEVEEGDQETDSRVIELQADIERLKGEVNRLAGLATIGEAYRSDLIEEALKSGVRVFGNDFRKEMYKSMLDRSSLEEIKALRDDFERQAKARYGEGGRQTKPTTLETGASAKRANHNQYQ